MGGQPAAVSPAQAAGRANLALIYQEILTAITRFRSNRQAVQDAGSFRAQIKARDRRGGSGSNQEGLRRGRCAPGHFRRGRVPG